MAISSNKKENKNKDTKGERWIFSLFANCYYHQECGLRTVLSVQNRIVTNLPYGRLPCRKYVVYACIIVNNRRSYRCSFLFFDFGTVLMYLFARREAKQKDDAIKQMKRKRETFEHLLILDAHIILLLFICWCICCLAGSISYSPTSSSSFLCIIKRSLQGWQVRLVIM